MCGKTRSTVGNKLSDVDIECNSDSIEVTISTSGEEFNGMVYPKGLSDNSSCLAEYEHAGSKITYRLPLRSCNTMSHDIVSHLLSLYNREKHLSNIIGIQGSLPP
ncbi:hypothetical protein AVEN_40168-1 [Araneus ventricosus]|uniref:ZP domain-containing protein n=1 Tax=Araneus ventricosus TaxID=182803 RepID=A0A4Y2PIC0_ARAVE|nr:hypothetical protein AVEN_40168-1 [Araneus ventricosus]